MEVLTLNRYGCLQCSLLLVLCAGPDALDVWSVVCHVAVARARVAKPSMVLFACLHRAVDWYIVQDVGKSLFARGLVAMMLQHGVVGDSLAGRRRKCISTCPCHTRYLFVFVRFCGRHNTSERRVKAEEPPCRLPCAPEPCREALGRRALRCEADSSGGTHVRAHSQVHRSAIDC